MDNKRGGFGSGSGVHMRTCLASGVVWTWDGGVGVGWVGWEGKGGVGWGEWVSIPV